MADSFFLVQRNVYLFEITTQTCSYVWDYFIRQVKWFFKKLIFEYVCLLCLVGLEAATIPQTELVVLNWTKGADHLFPTTHYIIEAQVGINPWLVVVRRLNESADIDLGKHYSDMIHASVKPIEI